MFEDSFTKIFSIQRRPQRQASPSQQTTQSHRSRVGQSPEYILKRVCPNQELDQDEVVEQERIIYSETHDLPSPQVVTLYKANGWSAANKPQRLLDALKNSHSLISAWDGETLVGLGSAISAAIPGSRHWPGDHAFTLGQVRRFSHAHAYRRCPQHWVL
jgi:hypothetical protein